MAEAKDGRGVRIAIDVSITTSLNMKYMVSLAI